MRGEGANEPSGWNRTLGLVILAVVIFAPQIVNRELMPPDEPRFALVGRAMFQSGDWVVQRRGGEIYMDKPPLLFWGQAAAFSLLGGPGEAAARIPPLVATLILTAVLHRTGRRWFGEPVAGRSTFIFLSMSLVLQRGAWVATDALLAAAVFASLAALEKARSRRGVDEAIAGVWCALGVLAKGPVALLFLFLAAGAAWITRRLVEKERQSPPVFSLAALFRPVTLVAFFALVLPWPVLLSLRLGFKTLWDALWKHNAQRFLHSWDNLEPWWYHPPTLLLGLLPWSILALAALAPAVLKTWSRDRRLLWLSLWGATALVFFSIPHGKRSVYLLPVYPALALVLAAAIPLLLKETRRRPILAGLHAVLAAGIGAAAMAILAGRLLPQEIRTIAAVRFGAATLLSLAALAFALMAWGLLTNNPNRLLAGPVVLALGSGILFPFLFTPAINAAQDARSFAADVRPLIPEGAQVALTRTKWELISWYTGLDAPWLSKPAQVSQFLAQNPPRAVIGARRELGPPTSWPPGTVIRATRRLGREEIALLVKEAEAAAAAEEE